MIRLMTNALLQAQMNAPLSGQPPAKTTDYLLMFCLVVENVDLKGLWLYILFSLQSVLFAFLLHETLLQCILPQIYINTLSARKLGSLYHCYHYDLYQGIYIFPSPGSSCFLKQSVKP